MTLLGHVDRITPEDLTSMVAKLLAQVQIIKEVSSSTSHQKKL